MQVKRIILNIRIKHFFGSKRFNILFVIALILFGGALVLRNTSETTPLVDFTYQLENSYRIAVGQVPYKDFFLVLTPGVYYLGAFFLEIFEQSNIGQIILVILVHSLMIILTNLILVKIAGNSIVTYLGTIITACSESVTYPYVTYNTLCFLLMLCFGVYFINNLYKLSLMKSLVIGILVALPFYSKQNYGLFFAVAFYFFFLFYCYKNKQFKYWIASLCGSLLTVVLFIIYLIYYDIKLHDFIYQTFIFPSETKRPLSIIFDSVMGAFDSATCVTYLYVFFLVLFFERDELNEKVKLVLSVIIFAGVWVVLTQVAHIRYDAATNFWQLIYIFLVFVWFVEAVFSRKLFSDLSITIIAFFILILGILTKREDGPLWLLCIVMALIYRHYIKRKCAVIVPLIMSLLLVWCAYQAKHIEMGYINEDGVLQVENNLNSKFYRIGIKGPWLNEMEQLTQYINENIGNESFVEVPCEDPIYWATGATPQMDFFQMYPETCPYPEERFVNVINEAGVKVIIVKRVCQFKHYMITEDEIDDFELKAEKLGYKLVDQCGIYDILVKQ